MELKASCHCKKVQFSFVSNTPYPYNVCHCSICRKLNGGAGTGCINIMGQTKSIKYENDNGDKYIKKYVTKEGDYSECATYLWNFHGQWPDCFYPFATCIDTELPKPPFRQNLMVKYAPSFAIVPKNEGDTYFDEYPDISIVNFHKKHNLYIEDK